MRITIERTIAAPAEKIFKTVAHIDEYSQAVPCITSFEFLSEQHAGVGTRFRETRSMKGKRTTGEFEVTEYEPHGRVRIVTDSHGAVWDTVFQLQSSGDTTKLSMVMDARAHKLLPKLLNPLLKGVIAKAVAEDMDLVKAYCEA